MPFINRLPVDSDTDGRAVVTSDSPISTDPYVAGNRYSDATALGVLYIIEGAVPAGVPFQNGVARTDMGQVYVLIDDPPATNARYYNDGILCDGLGHMCCTAINAIAGYMHGWPLDSIGQVCITGGSPPPPASTVSRIVVTTVGDGETAEPIVISQLYYGDSGSTAGFYSSKATFLSDHPSLTLQTFAGIAPPAGNAPLGSFTGFTVTVNNGGGTPFGVPTAFDDAWYLTVFPFLLSVYDTARSSSPFDNITLIDFSPAITTAGLNFASPGGLSVIIDFYDGATLLHTETTNPVQNVDVFTDFNGYSTGGAVAVNTRVTSDGDTRTTSAGDTRITA